MGFWHTGYIEFHEPSGLDFYFEPQPKIYYCKYCNAEFTSSELLRIHLFEGHPHDRPRLFLKEKEIASVDTVLSVNPLSYNRLGMVSGF